MELLHVIEIELLIGVALICGILSWGKPLGRQICMFVTLPLAYLLSFLLLKFGVLDGAGQALASLFISVLNLEDTVGHSSSAVTMISSVSSVLVRQLLIVPLFWVLRLVLWIIYHIAISVTKAPKRCKLFRSDTKTGKVKKGISCGLGMVSGCVTLMLTFTPFVFLSSLITPAVQHGEESCYEETYAGELSVTLDREVVSLFNRSPVLTVGKFIGVQQVMTATVHSLGDTSITTNQGQTVAYNVNDMFASVLRDGVDVLAINEYLQNPHKYHLSKLSSSPGILSDLAENPAILHVAAEVIPQFIPQTDEDDEDGFPNSILQICKDQYTGVYAADNLSNDMTHLEEILKAFISANPDCSLEVDDILNCALSYISEEANATALATHIASLSVYNSAVTELSVFGSEILCDMFDISKDQAEEYEKFKSLLCTAVNDRSLGRIGTESFDELETFIGYLCEEQIKLNDYRVQHQDPTTGEEDIACRIYDLYFRKANAIYSVYQRYGMYQSDRCLNFVASDGTVYGWTPETDLWTVSDDSLAEKPVIALTQVFVRETEMHFAFEQGTDISFEQISAWCETILTQLRSPDPALSASVKDLAAFTTEEQNFSPDVIYFEKLEQNIRDAAGQSSPENDQDSLTNLLVRAGSTLGILLGTDLVNADWLLVHFGEIGKLLDALYAFRLTKTIPESVLSMIAMTPEFSKYMISEDIQLVVDNVENGTSDFETFMSSVQALYNLALQIQ